MGRNKQMIKLVRLSGNNNFFFKYANCCPIGVMQMKNPYKDDERDKSYTMRTRAMDDRKGKEGKHEHGEKVNGHSHSLSVHLPVLLSVS